MMQELELATPESSEGNQQSGELCKVVSGRVEMRKWERIETEMMSLWQVIIRCIIET